MSRTVGDETVILHLGSGIYFGLDPIGTRIWQLICDGRHPSDICEALVAEYSQPRETIERDMGELLHELVKHRLISLSSD